MKALFLGLAACLVLLVPAATGKSSVTGWNTQFRQIMSWNDWQSTPTNTVYNTTGCVWNDMDEIDQAASGKLSTGQSTSDTLCLVTDMCNDSFCPHLVLFRVQAGQGLQVTLTNNWGGSWQALGVKSGSQVVYQLCVADPLHWGDPGWSYPPIAGTNGGVGYISDYTLTITATKTQQMGASFDIAPNHSEGEFGDYRQLSQVPCPAIN